MRISDWSSDVCSSDLTAAAGPVTLHFDLSDDHRLDTQIAAIRALRYPAPTGGEHVQLARRLLALQAVDARDAGASLREDAELLFGPGEWPGAGGHRKSLVRRPLDTGEGMLRPGPRPTFPKK